jgi:hypothetical protein
VLVGLLASHLVAVWICWRHSLRLREALALQDEARELLLRFRDLVTVHARPGAFRNGVQHGGSDEGEYWAGVLVDDAERWLEMNHEGEER